MSNPNIADPEYRLDILQSLLDRTLEAIQAKDDKGVSQWDRYLMQEARVILKQANDISEPADHLDQSKSATVQLLERLAHIEQLEQGLLRKDVSKDWKVRASELLEELEAVRDADAEGEDGEGTGAANGDEETEDRADA